MQKNNVINIGRQAMRPSRFFVMLNKVRHRFATQKGRHSINENLKWLEDNCIDLKEFAMSLDAKLWCEAELVSELLEKRASGILDSIEYELGGGGAYPFLHFITRYIEPDTIVETGVAAGFSSSAFLSAIKANGRGKLFSSDFPYFRIPNPEKYIGIVVEEKLRDGWELYIEGDKNNIPQILSNTNEIDIFHYDSDKSYSGREFAVSSVIGSLSSRGVLIMDDIQDNSFFYDYVEDTKPESWHVFKFLGKYVGIAGKLTRRST